MPTTAISSWILVIAAMIFNYHTAVKTPKVILINRPKDVFSNLIPFQTSTQLQKMNQHILMPTSFAHHIGQLRLELHRRKHWDSKTFRLPGGRLGKCYDGSIITSEMKQDCIYWINNACSSASEFCILTSGVSRRNKVNRAVVRQNIEMSAPTKFR